MPEQQTGPITTVDSAASGRLVVDAGKIGKLKKKLLTKKQSQMQARNKKMSSDPQN